MDAKDRIMVALDTNNLQGLRKLVEILLPHVGCFKIGQPLSIAEGPKFVQGIRSLGGKVFLDLKLYDTPETVAAATVQVFALNIDFLSVSCFGGKEMLAAAPHAVRFRKMLSRFTRIIGITVLTDLDYDDLVDLGLKEEIVPSKFSGPDELKKAKENCIESLVVHLARLAKDCGLDGIVASPKEAGAVRKVCGDEFIIVTPAIRHEWALTGSHKRYGTVREAILAGTDYLVIGRPITQSADPVGAAKSITKEIEAAFIEKGGGS